MQDTTERLRREMIPGMPLALRTALLAGEPTWTRETLIRDFDVLGFLAPLVAVRRKADGVVGSLQFATTAGDRHYFGWVAD